MHMQKISAFLDRLIVNRKVFVFLFCAIFGYAIWITLYVLHNQERYGVINFMHMGAEYYSIAESLASGRGFSDPFHAQTGPTAWMPPLFPFLLSCLVKIFSSRQAVGMAVFFLSNVVLVYTGVLLYDIARKTCTKINAAVIPTIYVLYLYIFPESFFVITHDTWLILLFIDILYVWTLKSRLEHNDRSRRVGWGIFGGLAALLTPVLGLTWAAVTLVFQRKKAIIPLCIAAFLCLSWTLRNYKVFGEPFLIKSNLYYDAYQANYVSESGVIDAKHLNSHPYFTTRADMASEYRQLGETGFSGAYRERFKESLLHDPASFLRKAARRLSAAFLVYERFGYPYDAFFPAKVFLYPLPFLALLFTLFFGRKEAFIFRDAAGLIYLVFLAPYVLFSFYLRYASPLLPLKVLFIGWAIDAGAAMLSRKRS